LLIKSLILAFSWFKILLVATFAYFGLKTRVFDPNFEVMAVVEGTVLTALTEENVALIVSSFTNAPLEADVSF
jgi:hypothetical protein